MDDKEAAQKKIEEIASGDVSATEAEAKEALNNYAKALAEEFAAATAVEPENIELHTLEFFRKNAHTAAAQIVFLSNNAESESVKLAASRLVLQSGMKAEENEKDPLAKILESLKNNDKKPQPANKES